MSKIYFIGDTHIGLGYPNKVDQWFKTHVEYFNDFLIPTLKKEVKPGDIIVHLGDLFDNRNIIPINLLNYGMDIVEEIAKIAPLHIIIGNHDLWTKSSSEINTVRPYKYIPNVFIYDKVKKIQFNGLNILMMPYYDNKDDQIKAISENRDCEYLFCHSDLNGAKMHLTSVAHRNNDKIDVEEFSSFRKVYSGHIHIVQSSKNFTFVGSIFQMDRNDIGNQKGIFVLDTNDGSEKFIENKVSPIFKKIRIAKDDDIQILENIDTRDYIDLQIANSLLIGNRKIRRKLEIILEKGKFASVDYIDDIKEEIDSNTKDDKVDLIVEEGEFKISINLEFEDYIREYISNQKWDSDNVKKGILSEYDEIVSLYRQNYKNKIDD